MLLNVRLLTVEEYHRMAEAGIFHPEERLELIEGRIIKMTAKGTAHESAITRNIELLMTLRSQIQMMVRVQSPIILNDNSEPEPDFTLVRVNPQYYADHHPTPTDIYLVIEIADSSFNYDRETKAKLYAQSGIVEYWVLDVNNRQLHVFREPSEDGYQSEVIVTADGIVSPLSFPTITIAVSEMLAPQV
jgi:Uma2 family endonuclease